MRFSVPAFVVTLLLEAVLNPLAFTEIRMAVPTGKLLGRCSRRAGLVASSDRHRKIGLNVGHGDRCVDDSRTRLVIGVTGAFDLAHFESGENAGTQSVIQHREHQNKTLRGFGIVLPPS